MYTRVPLNFMIRKYFDGLECISLIPINIGQKVASTSINVASSGIELGARVLNVPQENVDGYAGHMKLSLDSPEGATQTSIGPLFGDGSANFAACIPDLMRILEREWHSPKINADHLPGNDETYSGIQILYALVAWSGIQKITRVYHQRKWLSNAKEIEEWEWRGLPNPKEFPPTPVHTPGTRSRTDTIGRAAGRSRRNTLRSRPASIHVLSDYHLPDHGGEILTAEIGAPTLNPYPWSTHRLSQASFSRNSHFSMDGSSVIAEDHRPQKAPYSAVRHSLRRFSRMVLGGYGGAGVLLFGVKLPSIAKDGKITASFNEAGDGFTVKYSAPEEPKPDARRQRVLSLKDNDLEAAKSAETAPGEEHNTHSSFSVDVKIPRLPRQLAELVGAVPASDEPIASPSSPKQPLNSIPFPTASSSSSRPKPEWDERSILEDVMEDAGESDSDEDLSDDASAWEMLEPPAEDEEEYFTSAPSPAAPSQMRFWNLVRGLHDKEIFHAMATEGGNSTAANSPVQSMANLPTLVRREFARKRASLPRKRLPPVTHAGDAPMLPRFWALIDHSRQQVVLVLRGKLLLISLSFRTMTLNEVAIDLACDTIPFNPSWASSSTPSPSEPGPSNRRSGDPSEFWVHQGMYALAQLMGAPGKPVQQVVANALAQNEGYELILCGHSLGAGVCAVLGLMWGDPETCLTVESSGLPEGRPISVFCFAPPCVMSPSLSRTASTFITSFVWSHDIVSRLSLGGVRDIKAVTSWLLHGERFGPEHQEHVRNILRRIGKLELMEWLSPGSIEKEDEDWFLSLRKTLEANMHHTSLFPPGRIFWAMRDASFHPSLQKPQDPLAPNPPADRLRVFEVENPEEVFNQVIFSMDMLSSHFVQNYDKYLRNHL
ncbi:hypothetical protein FRB90_001354 [Tulasnella sp. 427]|nr:hypothetical protein FRB90_001354 [Tulasnella sp. 427]